MTRDELTRLMLLLLCRPRLDSIWADVRVFGLPVMRRQYDDWQGAMCGVLVGESSADVVYCGSHVSMPIHSQSLPLFHLDLLSSPIGADILARRVAFALNIDYRDWSMDWDGDVLMLTHEMAVGSVWVAPAGDPDGYGDEGAAIGVPTLADLDLTNTERVDWGKLGSARLVDLAALALVSQHLSKENRRNQPLCVVCGTDGCTGQCIDGSVA